mgnify:CR=1 FL=1
MRIWGITDTGLVRKENQDAYATAVVADCTVAVVCDGMGGTNGGHTASVIAVETLQQLLQASIEPHMDWYQLEKVTRCAIAEANQAIRARAAEDETLSRMGTTLVCAVCRDGEATLFNVGDSRGYLLCEDGIRQITRDHSVVENMVERGEITPAQARFHPNRNLITRALGPDAEVETDSFHVSWKQGDYLLLCTDGLINTVTDQEILFEVMHNSDLDGCLDRLLEASRKHGAPDNVTVVLLQNV